MDAITKVSSAQRDEVPSISVIQIRSSRRVPFRSLIICADTTGEQRSLSPRKASFCTRSPASIKITSKGLLDIAAFAQYCTDVLSVDAPLAPFLFRAFDLNMWLIRRNSFSRSRRWRTTGRAPGFACPFSSLSISALSISLLPFFLAPAQAHLSSPSVLSFHAVQFRMLDMDRKMASSRADLQQFLTVLQPLLAAGAPPEFNEQGGTCLELRDRARGDLIRGKSREAKNCRRSSLFVTSYSPTAFSFLGLHFSLPFFELTSYIS